MISLANRYKRMIFRDVRKIILALKLKYFLPAQELALRREAP